MLSKFTAARTASAKFSSSKFTIVSNPDPLRFHPKCKVLDRIAKRFLPAACILLFGLSGTRADTHTGTPFLCLSEPAHDGALLALMDRVYRADYAAADSIAAGLPDGPARAYFRGLVGINRFSDLGDTAALFAADRAWDRLDRAGDSAGSAIRNDPNYPLYRGLAELQMSYVANLTGGRIRSALLGRKAVKLLAPLARFAEAECALALYDYYKAQLLEGVDWLPFVAKADREKPLQALETAIPRSRYLQEILRTSLLWIYYDLGRYDLGRKHIEAFLARYPGNRPYRAMLADFRFRQGDVDSAGRIHERLAAEYRDLQTAYPAPAYLPLGYLSSVGNLAKISASRKQGEPLKAQLAIWYSPRYGGVMKWLPASLRHEVDSLKK
jgi:tetratricopeptide (TPR) repeat protein